MWELDFVTCKADEKDTHTQLKRDDTRLTCFWEKCCLGIEEEKVLISQMIYSFSYSQIPLRFDSSSYTNEKFEEMAQASHVFACDTCFQYVLNFDVFSVTRRSRSDVRERVTDWLSNRSSDESYQLMKVI